MPTSDSVNLVQKPFPFLSLPAEIRNAVYGVLVDRLVDSCHDEERDNSCLREQPAITRVNKQLRAESLPVFFGGIAVLLVTTESSRDWVPYIQRMVDAFTGAPGRPPSSTTLRLLSRVQFDFQAGPDIYIKADLVLDPRDLSSQQPDERSEWVAVGSPDLDWTDATVVRAACDEAAIQLEHDLLRRLTPDEDQEEIVSSSDVHDHEAALDALRIFALACPHLTSVCISDSSKTALVEVEDDPTPLSMYEVEFGYSPLDVAFFLDTMAEMLRDEEE